MCCRRTAERGRATACADPLLRDGAERAPACDRTARGPMAVKTAAARRKATIPCAADDCRQRLAD